MAEKISYEVDPYNRLVVRRSARGSAVARYRHKVEGTFVLGCKNTLIYQARKSSGYPAPQQLRFSGNWLLDKDHNLVFVLDKWNNQVRGDRLVIKGGIIDATQQNLVFQVSTRDSDGSTHLYILALSGSWQTDQHNRLTFSAEKEKGKTDLLTFEGAWEVDKANRLVYRYARRSLRRKEERLQTIEFRGRWQITGAHTISYCLSKEARPDSAFDFKVGLARAEKGVLRYELEAGVVPRTRHFDLTGTWRLDKERGLVFEARCQGDRTQALVFGAAYEVSGRDTLEARFDRGVRLAFTRKFLKEQGEVFVRALFSRAEVSCAAGAGLRW